MVLTAKKGQFFIIGTLLIASIITGYVVLDIGSFQAPQTQTPRHLFDRSMQEFPAAVNHLSGESVSPTHAQRRITSYLAFQQYTFASHGLSSRSHAITAVPQDENITILISNFHNRELNDIRVTVDGTTQTRNTLPHGETAPFTFSSTPRSMDVRTSFRADRLYNQSFSTSRDRRSALYHLRVEGREQAWQDTRTY